VKFGDGRGLSFERDEREEYWLGAYVLNFTVTEGGFAALILGTLLATWPDPPWRFIIGAAVVQTVVTPIVFYPFSKALWLAIDLVFRPAKASDFASADC
jgi:hypothetical protein